MPEKEMFMKKVFNAEIQCCCCISTNYLLTTFNIVRVRWFGSALPECQEFFNESPNEKIQTAVICDNIQQVINDRLDFEYVIYGRDVDYALVQSMAEERVPKSFEIICASDIY